MSQPPCTTTTRRLRLPRPPRAFWFWRLFHLVVATLLLLILARRLGLPLSAVLLGSLLGWLFMTVREYRKVC